MARRWIRGTQGLVKFEPTAVQGKDRVMPSGIEPVDSERWFSPGVRYSNVDWNDFQSVVRSFDERLNKWYLDVAGNLPSDSGFAKVALCCLIIDTLSQYRYGLTRSAGRDFRKFIRYYIPELRGPLQTTIRVPGSGANYTEKEEVLWSAFRCGILHEAHVPLFGGIDGGKSAAFTEEAPGTSANFDDGTPCPTYVLDPGKLLQVVKVATATYIEELLAIPPNREVRQKFAHKVKRSFGKTIPTT